MGLLKSIGGGGGVTAYDISAYRKIGTAEYEAWYTSQKVGGSSSVTGAATANYIIAMPFLVSKAITLDRIAINVTTQAAGLIRLGIYANDSSKGLYPGALLLDAGEVDTGSSGIKSITINQALTPGLYWLASNSNATPIVKWHNGGTVLPLLGTDNTLSGGSYIGLSKSSAFGPFPSTHPSAAIQLSGGAHGPLVVFVRLSA